MTPTPVHDELWAAVEPLLPPSFPRARGGRPPAPDRAALSGIVFVLRTGAPWRSVPLALGCSGVTCWRRLRDWQAAGVWRRLHRVLLKLLQGAGLLDWHRASIDSATVPAEAGGGATGPSPVDRGKPDTKRRLLVDAGGTPLGVALSPANRHDSKMLAETLDAVPPVRGRPGRPRSRPGKLHADKAYDHRRCRSECRRRGIALRIARRGVESSARLGRHRRMVERTLAWLSRFRRLAIRYERNADIHLALTTLACAVICLKRAKRF